MKFDVTRSLIVTIKMKEKFAEAIELCTKMLNSGTKPGPQTRTMLLLRG